ncbi:MAG: GNAT family N-acetyltransferase [Candidatus Obscuribacterales bacterium]|nr:GNAT family N-acetyltransferase [Candidatus Obscuribacterales bacterium]
MRLLVSYFEMTEAPSFKPVANPNALAAVKEEFLSTTDYLELYRAIGEPVKWDQRLRLELSELESILNSEHTNHFVLRFSGQSVGLCEFDRTGFPDIELVNFGLIPSMQGRGLGSFLLDFSLRLMWQYQPNRIWLHTDTNDHPNAIPTYVRFGFCEYMKRYEEFPE